MIKFFEPDVEVYWEDPKGLASGKGIVLKRERAGIYLLDVQGREVQALPSEMSLLEGEQEYLAELNQYCELDAVYIKFKPTEDIINFANKSQKFLEESNGFITEKIIDFDVLDEDMKVVDLMRDTFFRVINYSLDKIVCRIRATSKYDGEQQIMTEMIEIERR